MSFYGTYFDSAGGAFAFWTIGYALAYGGDDVTMPKTFAGSSGFFLATPDIDLHFWFIAEPTKKMCAYLLYSLVLAGVVYPICGHSYWSYNGFLSAITSEPFMGQGVINLAGSGPVHICGGAAALIMCIIIGPRKGCFYDSDGTLHDEPKPMGPHSVTLMFLGTFGLWFGWYGFNLGSVLLVSSSALGLTASLAAVNTTLGAADGALTAMFTSTIINEQKTGLYKWDTTASMNGCLTGLVAITAGCATIEPWAAFVIRIIAGWLYLAASKLILKLKIDDAVDAIPVHLFGGAWGVIAPGFFSNSARMEMAALPTEHVGLFYGGNGTLLGIQIIAVLFVFGWTFVTFTPFCLCLKFMNMLHMDPLEEEVGLDICCHKGPAYRTHEVKEGAKDDLSQRRNSGSS